MFLPDMSGQGQQIAQISLKDRLPFFIISPCAVHVDYRVEAKEDYYLIHLHVTGLLHQVCQRCMQEFDYPYDNHTVIAACSDEHRASELLEHYESIVATCGQVNLEEILVDEL